MCHILDALHGMRCVVRCEETKKPAGSIAREIAGGKSRCRVCSLHAEGREELYDSHVVMNINTQPPNERYIEAPHLT